MDSRISDWQCVINYFQTFEKATVYRTKMANKIRKVNKNALVP